MFVALLQAQAAEVTVPPPPAVLPLPLAYDAIQPPSFPPFFSSTGPPSSSAPGSGPDGGFNASKPQSGLAIPTISGKGC